MIILTNLELHPDQRKKFEALRDNGFTMRHVSEVRQDELANVEILLMERGEEWLTRDRVRAMTSLKLFQNVSAGVDHVDFGMFPPSVIVCGNVGAYGEQIAEFVIGAILYFTKNYSIYNDNLRNGSYSKKPLPVFLKGKTIGILGTGGIGKAVARISKSLGMVCRGVNTSGNPVEYFDSTVNLENIDSVISRADYLVVALPLTNKTRNLLDSKRLSLLNENSVLVNIARGAIIDKLALYEHLKRHPNSKAAIDVWWEYPKRGEKFTQGLPFFELPNFLGSPHISGDVPESGENAIKRAFENLERYVRNEKLVGVMDRRDYT